MPRGRTQPAVDGSMVGADKRHPTHTQSARNLSCTALRPPPSNLHTFTVHPSRVLTRVRRRKTEALKATLWHTSQESSGFRVSSKPCGEAGFTL
eukprot:354258-Chlamydomonas_euryale.AAC.3